MADNSKKVQQVAGPTSRSIPQPQTAKPMRWQGIAPKEEGPLLREKLRAAEAANHALSKEHAELRELIRGAREQIQQTGNETGILRSEIGTLKAQLAAEEEKNRQLRLDLGRAQEKAATATDIYKTSALRAGELREGIVSAGSEVFGALNALTEAGFFHRRKAIKDARDLLVEARQNLQAAEKKCKSFCPGSSG